MVLNLPQADYMPPFAKITYRHLLALASLSLTYLSYLQSCWKLSSRTVSPEQRGMFEMYVTFLHLQVLHFIELLLDHSKNYQQVQLLGHWS